jgi:hypothetical protein
MENKTNKKIKVGDKIWVDCACLREDAYYIVSSVKKVKTLVTVVVDVPANSFHKAYQITMYGHASSSLLSGFDRWFGNKDIHYTCDYELIEEKTRRYEWDRKYIDAGMAFLNLVKYIK